jgi:hypothetical protein
LTPQTINTWRKLRISAFQWYKGMGVADRVFHSKNSSPRTCYSESFLFSNHQKSTVSGF